MEISLLAVSWEFPSLGQDTPEPQLSTGETPRMDESVGSHRIPW